jgi:hypothetical protein
MVMLFGSTPGVVGVQLSGPALPFSIAVGGNPGVPAFESVTLAKAVLTGFTVDGETGLGVGHTLRDRIYFYVFGGRATPAVVSGVAFAGVCNRGTAYTGFDAVYSYYETVRASTQGAAVRLVFGPATTLYGFMYKFSFRLGDPQTGLGEFSFMFEAIPRGSGGSPIPPLTWEPLLVSESVEEAETDTDTGTVATLTTELPPEGG